jgi:hypothetical protein
MSLFIYGATRALWIHGFITSQAAEPPLSVSSDVPGDPEQRGPIGGTLRKISLAAKQFDLCQAEGASPTVRRRFQDQEGLKIASELGAMLSPPFNRLGLPVLPAALVTNLHSRVHCV